jgi:hypothetical protein
VYHKLCHPTDDVTPLKVADGQHGGVENAPVCNVLDHRQDLLVEYGTVRVFRQKFTLEDAIGSHACSLEASRRVTNGVPLGSSLFLPLHTVNCVQTLKVSALATDHLNDCLTNTVALIGSGLAAKVPDADPAGAIVIGIYIMYSWYNEGRENIVNLAGQTASPEVIKKLTYIAMHHDNRVRLVDTVRAIHLGTNVLVEVDIVLSPEMTLYEARCCNAGVL